MSASQNSQALLRGTALIASLAGAAGSFAFMLRAGHRNNSRALLALFTIWVLSPFALLVVAWAKSKGWTVPARTALYTVTLILLPVLLAIYGYAALHPPRKPAAVFLMVPAASWLLMAAIATAAFVSGRRSRGV